MEMDYFRLDVGERKVVTVWSEGDADTVGELELETPDGVESIAYDDDGGDGLNFSISGTLEAGTYYVQLSRPEMIELMPWCAVKIEGEGDRA